MLHVLEVTIARWSRIPFVFWASHCMLGLHSNITEEVNFWWVKKNLSGFYRRTSLSNFPNDLMPRNKSLSFGMAWRKGRGRERKYRALVGMSWGWPAEWVVSCDVKPTAKDLFWQQFWFLIILTPTPDDSSVQCACELCETMQQFGSESH